MGKPQNMAEKKEVGNADLRKRIVEILKDVDFETTSAKKVRLQLQRDFDTDLVERREEIMKLMAEVIVDMDEEEGNVGEGEKEKDKKSTIEVDSEKQREAENVEDKSGSRLEKDNDPENKQIPKPVPSKENHSEMVCIDESDEETPSRKDTQNNAEKRKSVVRAEGYIGPKPTSRPLPKKKRRSRHTSGDDSEDSDFSASDYNPDSDDDPGSPARSRSRARANARRGRPLAKKPIIN